MEKDVDNQIMKAKGNATSLTKKVVEVKRVTRVVAGGKE